MLYGFIDRCFVASCQVRKHFQPEFINRVDDFIIFEPLEQSEIEKIVQLRTTSLISRIASERKIRLVLRDSAIKCLAAEGYDPVYGARPVKRSLQRQLETPLAKALLKGTWLLSQSGMLVALTHTLQLHSGF